MTHVKMPNSSNSRSNLRDNNDEGGDESEEELIDYQVLSKLRFQQISERKQWQGVNISYSGIPGTSSLNPNEGIMMFVEERGEIDAQTKIIDIFKEIHEVITGSLQYYSSSSMKPHGQSKSSMQRTYFAQMD